MGVNGPVPKRSEERIRRNLDEVPIDNVTMIGNVDVPDLLIDDPHPLTKHLYDSMRESGQVKYYEPSDWGYALTTMHFLDKLLKKSDPSAMMLTAINQMLSNLLLTEGDRRRVRIEVERNQNQEQVGKVLEVADLFRQALTNNTGQVPGGS